MADNSKKSVAHLYDGPWMRPEVLAKLPQLGWQFDKNRDPYIARQMRDLDKPEAQRRRESVAYEARLKFRPAYRIQAIEQDNARGDTDRGDTSRGEQTGGRASNMVSKSQPKANLRPSEHIARPVDQSTFKQAWLKEQRDAVMARVKSERQDQSQERSHDITQERQMKGPER